MAAQRMAAPPPNGHGSRGARPAAVPRAASEAGAAPRTAPVMDDAMLLAGVRAGDAQVADAFCRRIWPQVDRTIRRLLGRDDTDREDLSQLAVIELVRTIGGYRGECSLDTWTSAVTAHLVYKHIRRRPLERHVSLDAIHEETVASGRLGSEGTVAVRQVLGRILHYLDGMGEKLAWAFVLHDVLGYGLRDAAKILGVSEAAAQSRLVRGRTRLHRHIADDPELADLLGNLARARGDGDDREADNRDGDDREASDSETDDRNRGGEA